MRARRRFGQHFLEPVWQRKVLEVIAPQPGERFLEIGPGRGALTLGLSGRGAEVVGIEVDRDLAADLTSRALPRVRIVCADVLETDLAALARDMLAEAGTSDGAAKIRIAANLPYNISSPVLFRLIDLARSTDVVGDATLMLQREVAERVAAHPGGGTYGPLSIMAALVADVSLVLLLPPGAFRPPPKVDSAVIQMRFRPSPLDIGDVGRFESLVRAAFTQRRKTVMNALRPYAARHGVDAIAAIGEAGIDGRRRPETLTIAEFASIAAQFPPLADEGRAGAPLAEA